MITAHGGHFLHPESLQPLTLPASLNHIELDATKSPLALLARTCSQIGKSNPPSSTNPTNDSKDSECLKTRNISFCSKPVEKNVPEPSAAGRCVLRTQSSTCRPLAVCSPKIQDEDEKNDGDGNKTSHKTSETIRSGSSEINNRTRHKSESSLSSSEQQVGFSSSSSLGLDIPQFPTFLLPQFPVSCAGFPQPGTPVISTGLCGDPYCLSYNCTASLKSTFPLPYRSHSLPSSSTSAFTVFPHGFMHPHELQSCVFNSVSANPSETSLYSSVVPTLRNPPHMLGLGTRYHPYFKTPFPTAPKSYYTLQGLYGQKLHLAP